MLSSRSVSLLSGSLQYLPYIDADGWKSNLSVIRPFGVMVYCGIYVLVLHVPQASWSHTKIHPFGVDKSNLIKNWPVYQHGSSLIERYLLLSAGRESRTKFLILHSLFPQMPPRLVQKLDIYRKADRSTKTGQSLQLSISAWRRLKHSENLGSRIILEINISFLVHRSSP